MRALLVELALSALVVAAWVYVASTLPAARPPSEPQPGPAPAPAPPVFTQSSEQIP
jgi:hypothetical protein